MDRLGLVEKKIAVADPHHLDQFLGRLRVDAATLQARVDEGAKPHMGQCAGLAGGDIPIKLADHALGQIIGFDQPVGGQLSDLGDQAPMPADHAFQKALKAQPVEAAILAVALTRREEQGQVPRGAGFEKLRFDRGEQSVGHADPDKARGGDGVPGGDQRRGVAGRDDLVFHLCASRSLGEGYSADMAPQSVLVCQDASCIPSRVSFAMRIARLAAGTPA